MPVAMSEFAKKKAKSAAQYGRKYLFLAHALSDDQNGSADGSAAQ